MFRISFELTGRIVLSISSSLSQQSRDTGTKKLLKNLVHAVMCKSKAQLLDRLILVSRTTLSIAHT